MTLTFKTTILASIVAYDAPNCRLVGFVDKQKPSSTPFSLSITFAHTDISSDTPLYKSHVQLYKGEVKTEEEEQDNILTRAPEKPTEDVISSKIHRSVTETKLNEVLPVR